jgi:GDP-fucose protein O-fucosyltransferase
MLGQRRTPPQQQQQQHPPVVALKRNGPFFHPSCPCISKRSQRPTLLSMLLVVTILLSTVIYYYLYIITDIQNDAYYYHFYTHSNSFLDFTTILSNGTTSATISNTHAALLFNEQDSRTRSKPHPVAELSCQIYGGPTSKEAIHEMIYWYNIPSDSNYYMHPSKGFSKTTTEVDDDDDSEERYLTFEPDEGGWNNIRMALETSIAMAISMRRTLVLPPDMKYYLLWNNNDRTNKSNNNNNNNKSQTKRTRNVMNFDDFFHLESIQREYSNVLRIMTMEEFLLRVGMKGQLRSRSQNRVRYPNRTNWSSTSMVMNNYESIHNKHSKSHLLWEYIRDVTQPLVWDSETCVAVFPSLSSSSSSFDTTSSDFKDGMHNDVNTVDTDTQRQLDYLQTVLQKDQIQFADHLQQLPPHKRRFVRLHQLRQDSYRNHPTPVNATATERLAELMANRKQLCIYNQSIHQQFKVLHMTGSEARTGSSSHHETTSNRFLIHFYAFLFYENYHTDLFIKRFIRDHLRYVFLLYF